MAIRFLDEEESVQEPQSQGSRIRFLDEQPLTEEELDIQEAQARPDAGEFVLEALGGAKKEIGGILNAVGTLIANPIESTKAIAGGVKNLKGSDVKNFAVGLAQDFGKTFGYDINRPGEGFEKFDIDTAINRWKEAPIAALGDATIFIGALKGISAAGKATAKLSTSQKVAHNALKRSGDDIAEMAKSVVSAKDKAIQRGALSPVFTSGEKVAMKGDVIKKIPLKSLNSADFPKDQSVQLADRIFEIGRRQAKLQDQAIKKATEKGVKINGSALASKIEQSLVKNNFAKTAKEAVDVAVDGAKGADNVNVIPPLNKAKLNKFLDLLDDGGDIPIKELHDIRRAVDDSINWISPRTSDDGLKIMRRAMREALSEGSEEYGRITGKIGDRLTEIGYAENKIKRAKLEGWLRNYKEKVGLEIAKSDQRSEAFLKAMDIVGNETAEAALGRFELIDAWKAWNDLYGQNQSTFKIAGDVRGRAVDKLYNFVSQRFRKKAPGLPEALAEGAKGTIRIAGRGARAGATRLRQTLPVGTTLTEQLISEE